MTAMPDDDPVDWDKSRRITEAAELVMGQERPDIAWMTGELANTLLAMFSAQWTKMNMSLLRGGMDPEEAKRLTSQQIPLLALDLGLRIGTAIESARAMREMFGDLGEP